MKLFPLLAVAQEASLVVAMGHIVYQQFLCSGCKVKQTMEVPNTFFAQGKCEACGHMTDIQKDGCNYIVLVMLGVPAPIRTRTREDLN